MAWNCGIGRTTEPLQRAPKTSDKIRLLVCSCETVTILQRGDRCSTEPLFSVLLALPGYHGDRLPPSWGLTLPRDLLTVIAAKPEGLLFLIVSLLFGL